MSTDVFELLFSEENGVEIEIIDYDEDCRKDLSTGKGFRISESTYKKQKNKKHKTNLYGLQSPLYGTNWDDEENIIDPYRCVCGAMQGRINKGEKCKSCFTEVIFRDVDLKIFGWIVLDHYYIIHPLMYKLLESAIGPAVLLKIISYEKEIDLDGNLVDTTTKIEPFSNIGIIEFKRRFMEIMLYYRKKKKKFEVVDFILNNQEKVFIQSIPVYTSVLRPYMIKDDDFIFSEIDKKYNPIVSIVNHLNLGRTSKAKLTPIDVGLKLFKVQSRLEEIWELNFSDINQKSGFIKDQIIGGRLNNSARNVIIPDPTLRSNEIKIGYSAFMELYKGEIIAIVSKMSNITENEAEAQWNKAMITYNHKFYTVMKQIIKKMDPCVLINRNPTKLNWLAVG